jgi:hypothetical protein
MVKPFCLIIWQTHRSKCSFSLLQNMNCVGCGWVWSSIQKYFCFDCLKVCVLWKEVLQTEWRSFNDGKTSHGEMVSKMTNENFLHWTFFHWLFSWDHLNLCHWPSFFTFVLIMFLYLRSRDSQGKSWIVFYLRHHQLLSAQVHARRIILHNLLRALICNRHTCLAGRSRRLWCGTHSLPPLYAPVGVGLSVATYLNGPCVSSSAGLLSCCY